MLKASKRINNTDNEKAINTILKASKRLNNNSKSNYLKQN